MKGADPDSEYHLRARELTSAEGTALRTGTPATRARTAVIFVIHGVLPGVLYVWFVRRAGMEEFSSHLVGGALGLAQFLAFWLPTRRPSRMRGRDVEAVGSRSEGAT